MISSRHIAVCSLVCLGIGASAAPPRRSAPAAPPQQVTGPVATYWMSAATTSGQGFGALAGMGGSGGGTGKQPSLGEMMRMMRGGTSVDRALILQLGSTLRASGAPTADHLPGTGTPLPLVTPVAAPPAPPTSEETVEEQPRMAQPPKGRILLYWGCGEHAGPGQPIVLDFTKMLAGQDLPRLPYVAVHRQNPPSAARSTTYGEWPANQRDRRPPASLVGDHQVRGSYSPDIRFALPTDREWMAPLLLDAAGKTPAGATRLGWGAVPGATGYFATLFGATAERGAKGDAPTLVMWSSSSVATFAAGGLIDYLAPAEVQRLIGQKAVMPPGQTECVVPVEVAGQGRFGLVSMIAYGPETNLADPPRPVNPRTRWNISWTVKARYKSTTGVILGMSAPAPGPAGADGPPPPPRKRGGLLGKLKDAADALPR